MQRYQDRYPNGRSSSQSFAQKPMTGAGVRFMQRKAKANVTSVPPPTAEEQQEIDDIWNHNPIEDEKKREKAAHEAALAKARDTRNKHLLKIANATEFEKDSPAGYKEHINFVDPGMSFEEMHEYDTAEAMRKGVQWSKKSRHADLTYPMNKTAKVYNFPDSKEAIAAAKAANATGNGTSFIA